VTQQNSATIDKAQATEAQADFDKTVAAPGQSNGAGGSQEVEEGRYGQDWDQSVQEKDCVQKAPGGSGDAVDDAQAIADAPPAGRHAVRLLRVTLVIRSGDHGYELLLQSGVHLWRPRPLWFRADRVAAAIVKRDFDNVLVPLLRAVTAPGELTEAEAAEAMIGLAFVATVDASGAVTKAEAPI
jgi:hypothetical protein